jgi:hypothetical protein
MEDNRLIVILSGGRSCGRVACIGLFLPGDIERLEYYSRYIEFNQAMANVGQAMTAAYETVSQQLKEIMAQVGPWDNIKDLLQAMADGAIGDLDFEEYYPKDPLPKPPKIIPAFKVYEAYKGRLNYKPVYYHCRNNC